MFLSAIQGRRIKIAAESALALFLGLASLDLQGQASQPVKAGDKFQVQLFESLPDTWREGWSFEGLKPALSWTTSVLGVTVIPGRISPAGLRFPKMPSTSFAPRTSDQVRSLTGL